MGGGWVSKVASCRHDWEGRACPCGTLIAVLAWRMDEARPYPRPLTLQSARTCA